MFPDEGTAMGWNTLTQLYAFLNVQNNLRDALANIFGNFTDSIAYVAQLPEAIWRQGVQNSRIITQAAIIADPAAGIAGQAAVTRRLLPVETGQAGMIWRVASRIFWVRAGRAWGDYMDFDVMLPPAERTAAFAYAPPPAAGGGPMAVGVPGTKHKQSTSTDQNDESEFLAPTRAETDTYSANYYAQKNHNPDPEEEAGAV